MTEDKSIIEEAKKIVIENNYASASLLQRKLQIGYARAALILDILEEQCIIGKADCSKQRQIII